MSDPHIAVLPALALESGRTIDPLLVAYETWGELDETAGNVVLVCHALTGNAHAASLSSVPGGGGRVQGGIPPDSTPPSPLSRREGERRTKGGTGAGAPKGGWWEGLIGPGRAIDTDRYFVVCSNVIGSCYGSSGPLSIDPETGAPYGSSFPAVTIRDMVHAQRALLDSLGVARVALVIGGSMGGMQFFEWGLLQPEFVDRLAPIASSARHSPWAVAFNTIAREAIALGRRGGDAAAGLGLARKVAMMTYRSGEEFAARFDRGRTDDDLLSHRGFAVNGWLGHHADALVARFDDRVYELLTAAMDTHDITRGRGDLATTLGSIAQPVLVVGIRSDILYPVEEQHALVRSLPDATYREIDAASGHDAFLIEMEQLAGFIREFLATTHSQGKTLEEQSTIQGRPTLEEQSCENILTSDS